MAPDAALNEAGEAVDALRFIRTVAAAREPSVRRALWAEALRTRPPEAAARLLEMAARRACIDAASLAVYLPLVDYEGLAEAVGAEVLGLIAAHARMKELPGALLLVETRGAPVGRRRLGPPPDPICEQLTLGARKAAARGVRSALLERLLKDPDPRVVREALRNPRLREGEVVAIASRRPCPEPVFHHLAAAPRWIARRPVQRAVALNPYAPPRLACALLVCLPEEALREVAQSQGLHPAVRNGALEIARWRRTAAV